jgi:hypothetical protein
MVFGFDIVFLSCFIMHTIMELCDELLQSNNLTEDQKDKIRNIRDIAFEEAMGEDL